jgi:RNA polymerase sigma-70 factor (ECF subfamily)
VQVLRYSASFRGESSLRTWISRIAIRSALTIQARRRRRPDVELTDERSDLASGPAEQVADNEGAVRLLRAIARLPAEQRLVLGLAAFDDMPGVEIAQVLGIPEGTVYSRLHAARSKLRTLL